jgi:hypothetical protein
MPGRVGIYAAQPCPYVASLLHLNQSPFTDVQGRTVTNVGGVTTDATNTRFGDKTALFNGTSGYLDVAGRISLPRDFTLQGWSYLTDTTQPNLVSPYRTVCELGGLGILLRSYHAANSQVYVNGTHVGNVTADWFGPSVWNYFVLNRSGNTVQFYTNGALRFSYNATNLGTVTGDLLTIGRSQHNGISQFWKGNLADIRIVKDAALDGTQVPTQPFAVALT